MADVCADATAGADDHDNSWRLRKMPFGIDFKLGDAFKAWPDTNTSTIFNLKLDKNQSRRDTKLVFYQRKNTNFCIITILNEDSDSKLKK